MLCKHEVVGSNPSGSTIWLFIASHTYDEPHEFLTSADCRVGIDIVNEGFARPKDFCSKDFRADFVEDIVWQLKTGVRSLDRAFMGFAELTIKRLRASNGCLGAGRR